MENVFHYLLRLFGDGMTLRTEKLGTSDFMAHVENRDRSRCIDFLAEDEKDAERIAKEWMLGQMFLNYKEFREVAIFITNRIRTIKEIDDGKC